MEDVLIPSAGVTEEILRFSARIHNGFPPDTAFPKIDIFSDAVEKLCAIFAKYNAQSHFRLRLLHRHTTIPDGQVLLGVSIAEDLGFWTKSTPISDVDLERIHPHVLSVNTTTSSNEDKNDAMLFPSEFREGPPVSTDIDAHFFTEIANCLCANNLEHSIGLEAIQGQSEKMMEFSFDAGSLLLKEAVVKGQFDFLETVWAVTEDGAVDKDGETRCVIVQGQHHKVTKAKANGASDVLRILEAEGVVVLPAKV